MEICVSCIPHVLFVSFPIVLHCFLLFSICRRCPSFPLELFLCFPFFFVFPLFAFLPFPLVSCCFRSFPAHFLFLPFVSHRFIPFPIVSYCFPPFPSVSLFPIVTRFFSLLVSFRSPLFPTVSYRSLLFPSVCTLNALLRSLLFPPISYRSQWFLLVSL